MCESLIQTPFYKITGTILFFKKKNIIIGTILVFEKSKLIFLSFLFLKSASKIIYIIIRIELNIKNLDPNWISEPSI